MDRFTEEPMTLKQYRAVLWDDDISTPPPSFECDNCWKTVPRVTYIPEYDLVACDECYEEAQRAIAKEQTEMMAAPPEMAATIDISTCVLYSKAGLTTDQARALESSFPKEAA